MSGHDFSQSGEQPVILEACAELGLHGPHSFLDIGAGDGETFSNTKALADLGWRGVAVEPAAWAFDRLSARCQPTNVIPVCAVVVPIITTPIVPFAYSRDDHLSSTDPRQLAKWRQVQFENVAIAAVSLHELVNQFGPFQVVSIDAEGLTLDLVDAYRRHQMWDDVRLIVYELEHGEKYDLRDTAGPGTWVRVARTPNNAIYAR